MLISCEFRMYPNDSQKELLAKHFGHCRWFYNYALNKRIRTYEATKKTISRFDLSSDLPKLKLDENTKWLKEVNSQSLQATLLHLDVAYKKFFTKSGGFPKFKNKHSKQSFEIPENLKVDFELGVVIIPKFKEPIKTKFHRTFEGQIKTCSIKKSNTGKYFISILVEDGKELPTKPEIRKETSIGIDVGIKSFLVTSDGEEVSNPRFLIQSQHKLKKIQRSFSRKMKLKKKGESLSKNAEKQKLRLQLLHEHVTNQRKDWLHKLTTRLIRENQTICVEDLNVKGMMKNRKLSKSIADAGWGSFFTMLKYKSEWYGRNILTIGRFEPSSKTCSNCGYIKPDLTLKDRTWLCPTCNEIHDRDINASINIKNIALDNIENNNNNGINNTGLNRNTQKSKPVIYGNSLESSTGRTLAMVFEAHESLAHG